MDFVTQLIQDLEATPEIERQYFVTNRFLKSLPNELRIAVIRMAKHEYFDLEILLADCPEFMDSVESIYSQLQNLCIVEEFPHRGFNIHELTRSHIMSK